MRRPAAKFCRNILILAGFTMTVSACYGPPPKDLDHYSQPYGTEEEGPQVEQGTEDAGIDMNDCLSNQGAVQEPGK